MAKQQDSTASSITQPPQYCEYAAGPCDQTFDAPLISNGLFLYPSDPEILASTIEEGVAQLPLASEVNRWISWKSLDISGQIIFCTICKAIRFTQLVVADVTTLNFNLLFEIGYALGLGQHVVPIRDTTYVRDRREFDQLGLLETRGYLDFQNSATLVDGIADSSSSVVL